jgi:regulator of protease activity HflC (stomatin/prohibitin superfamily)
MAFPYPEDPATWQTAYTRNQAYRDSDKNASAFMLPVAVGFLVAVGYVILKLFRIIGHFSAINWALISLAIFVILIVTIAATLKGAFRFATGLFVEYYSPPDTIEPREVITFRLFGVQRPPPPPFNALVHSIHIIAREGELEKKEKWTSWMACTLGGPLVLTVFDGCALYLERGGRFSRVVGPGEKVPFLELHETIKTVVDLRPKVKTDEVHAWTKDGINITLTVRIECRIGDPAKKDPAAGLVFPFDPEGVKLAVERTALRWPKDHEEPDEFTWMDAAWGQVTGIIPGYVGSRMLDDILIAERQNGQILSSEAIEKIHLKLNQETKKFGVYITDLQIIKVEIPDEVMLQHKENWGAERQSISMIIDGQAKAFSIRSREKARADAQRDLILAIAEGLEKNKSKKFIEPLLLSLSGVLDSSLSDPQLRAYLAKETLDTLEKLQTMLEKPVSKGN